MKVVALLNPLKVLMDAKSANTIKLTLESATVKNSGIICISFSLDRLEQLVFSSKH
jgi:hypothetical protein